MDGRPHGLSRPFEERASGTTLTAVVLAAVVAIAGGLFSRLTLIGVRGLPGVLGKLQRQHPAVFAALCGLVVSRA